MAPQLQNLIRIHLLDLGSDQYYYYVETEKKVFLQIKNREGETRINKVSLG